MLRKPRGAGQGDAGSRVEGRGRKKSASLESSAPFVLYVEGARDRQILEYWARRVDPQLARLIEGHAVILGGRRPARAVSDFRKRGGSAAGLTGLVVLDRDDHGDVGVVVDEEALEIFIWSQRHIESYLLVPAVLRRLIGLDPEDKRIERFVEDEQNGHESLHAKRILGAGGSLSEVLGAQLRAEQIARAMRREDLHQDILDLFARIARAAGLSPSGPEVVVRSRSGP
ncbi:MAG: hypothetical protein V3T64_07695 [Myxococcota bacterium]